ncbi:MAG: DUF4331 domain-containing protein, partial [Actinomycetota bacterium]
PAPGSASSHREAPLISSDPQVDTTDVYAFRSPDSPETVTLLASWLPFEEPAGGPNFYAFDDNAMYDLNVSNDGDPKPEIVFRFDFTDSYRNPNTFLYNTGPVDSLSDGDLNFFQTYDLHKLTFKKGTKKIKKQNGTTKTKKVLKTKRELLVDDGTVAPSDVGDASMDDYENELFLPAVTPVSGGGQAFAGQSDDPFFLDLRIFDLLYGGMGFPESGDETLDGFNVQTTALQVPRSLVARDGNVDGNPVIGVWATASRRGVQILKKNGSEKFEGPLVQVSRLGMPLVNEAVIPVGQKDLWNRSVPKDDGQFLSYVTDPEVPKLVEAIFGVPAPATPRNDLVEIFLTGIAGLNQPAGVAPSEMLRLNLTTPVCEPMACMGYSEEGVIDGDLAGFPNGRRLADDVIDISLNVLEQLPAQSLGDGEDVNPEGFRTSFPYVQIPTSGSEADPHS